MKRRDETIERDGQDRRQKNMQLPADCGLHLLYITSHINVLSILKSKQQCGEKQQFLTNKLLE